MQRKLLEELSPTEFEAFCLDVLSAYAEAEALKDFEIIHNKIIETHDGKYQIDVYAQFTALGTCIKMFCECKKYKRAVERDKVVALQGKLESIGAHKGVLISTSGFQSGAISYAKEHGIALFKASNYVFEQILHSAGPTQPSEDDPFCYAERNWPPYEAFDYTADGEEPKKIYPPKSIVIPLLEEQQRLICNLMGID